METVASKRVKFCQQLSDLTAKRRISWKKDTGNVYAGIGGNYVYLWGSHDDEMSPLEHVEITSADNTSLDLFSDVDLGEEGAGMWIVMRDTRLLAERQSSGIDETLDSMLEALSEIEAINTAD